LSEETPESVVLCEIDARGVATVTLNRPQVFNSYNPALLTGLTQTLIALEDDARVRVIVLRGAGKHFSAGADVNWFKILATASEYDRLAASRLSTGAMRKLAQIAKPTIALVHNACFGGGAGYAAACDIVIASDDARFAVTEVKIGITPAPILRQLIDAIGVRNTRRYALTAETFDVHVAQQIGLVQTICPVGGLDAAAAPVIDAILRCGPIAIRDTKRLIPIAAEGEYGDALAEMFAGISAAGRITDEAKEGFSSFLEKRNPSWYPGS
jgi:methylglutaconyl-CoA hydratase